MTLKTCPTVEEVMKYGLHFYYLVSQQAHWIIRRNTKWESINRDTHKYSITYDIDFEYVSNGNLDILKKIKSEDELVELGVNLNFSDEKSEGSRSEKATKEVWIPIDIFRKDEFLDLDIKSQWQSNACVLTRKENTRVVIYLLVGFLQCHGFKFANNIDKRQDELNNLYEFLLFPEGNNSYKEKFYKKDIKDNNNNTPLSDYSKIEDCLENPEFYQLLSFFLEHFLLVISVPITNNISRTTIKFSVEEKGGLQRTRNNSLGPDTCKPKKVIHFLETMAQYIGGPFATVIQIPQSPNHHIKSTRNQVVLPEEMKFLGVYPETHRSSKLHIKYTSNKATVHFNSLEPPDSNGKQKLNEDPTFFISTKNNHFNIPAISVILFSIIVSWWTAYLMKLEVPVYCARGSDITGKFDGFVAAYTSILIPLIIFPPSISAAFLILRKEHEDVTINLGFSRTILLFSTIATFLFGLLSVSRMITLGAYSLQKICRSNNVFDFFSHYNYLNLYIQVLSLCFFITSCFVGLFYRINSRKKRNFVRGAMILALIIICTCIFSSTYWQNWVLFDPTYWRSWALYGKWKLIQMLGIYCRGMDVWWCS